MSKSTFIIFLILFFKVKYAEGPPELNFWVVWNIGQGQWVTHVTTEACLHFDVGGEFGSFKRIRKRFLSYCGDRPNQLYLSHWDADHFLNVGPLAKSVPKLCWQKQPGLYSEKVGAQKILALHIPFCHEKPAELSQWLPVQARSTNDSSQVFIHDKVLLQGDSPIQQENQWSTQMNLQNVKILVLGHHGSRTSTGRELLQRLPTLTLAIASARFAKYRHPHTETLKRLSDFNIPVLKTEDWGNIWIRP